MVRLSCFQLFEEITFNLHGLTDVRIAESDGCEAVSDQIVGHPLIQPDLPGIEYVSVARRNGSPKDFDEVDRIIMFTLEMVCWNRGWIKSMFEGCAKRDCFHKFAGRDARVVHEEQHHADIPCEGEQNYKCKSCVHKPLIIRIFLLSYKLVYIP